MSADLSTSRFAVPDSVLASQRARERARNQHVQCAGDGGRCRRPAKHSCARWGGAYCDGCWAELPRTTAVPDPARTVAGLRALQVESVRAAELLRDVALDGVHERSDEWAKRAVHDAIVAAAASGRPFSANDLRGVLPPGIPGPLIGACFRRAASAGLIRKTDRRVPSTDPGTHAHEIAVWEGA